MRLSVDSNATGIFITFFVRNLFLFLILSQTFISVLTGAFEAATEAKARERLLNNTIPAGFVELRKQKLRLCTRLRNDMMHYVSRIGSLRWHAGAPALIMALTDLVHQAEAADPEAAEIALVVTAEEVDLALRRAGVRFERFRQATIDSLLSSHGVVRHEGAPKKQPRKTKPQPSTEEQTMNPRLANLERALAEQGAMLRDNNRDMERALAEQGAMLRHLMERMEAMLAHDSAAPGAARNAGVHDSRQQNACTTATSRRKPSAAQEPRSGACIPAVTDRYRPLPTDGACIPAGHRRAEELVLQHKANGVYSSTAEEGSVISSTADDMADIYSSSIDASVRAAEAEGMSVVLSSGRQPGGGGSPIRNRAERAAQKEKSRSERERESQRCTGTSERGCGPRSESRKSHPRSSAV